ncbi:MAG: sensor histidine kinase [Thermodesulfobacteriota bacterium]
MITSQNSPETNRPSKTDNDAFFREVQIEFLIHELKDPISVIETGVKALLTKRDKYGALSATQEKTLNRVLRNTKKAWEMLNNLMEIGRSEAGCFISCRFQPAQAAYEALLEALETKAAMIAEHSSRYTERKEILQYLNSCGISFQIAPQLSEIELFQDEIKFRQIVGNLIKNALHYRKDLLEIRMARENDCLCIDVTDDGPGIDPEHHQAIFRRYTQLNPCETVSRQGHGLGLAGALIMAKNLGGDIELKSVKGKGATFRLILPLAPCRHGLKPE